MTPEFLAIAMFVFLMASIAFGHPLAITLLLVHKVLEHTSSSMSSVFPCTCNPANHIV